MRHVMNLGLPFIGTWEIDSGCLLNPGELGVEIPLVMVPGQQPAITSGNLLQVRQLPGSPAACQTPVRRPFFTVDQFLLNQQVRLFLSARFLQDAETRCMSRLMGHTVCGLSARVHSSA